MMYREPKVFWVVAWDRYYPSGGLNNVKSTHSTREEAAAAASQLPSGAYDFVEIIDISDML
jgi:hypothetical protein